MQSLKLTLLFIAISLLAGCATTATPVPYPTNLDINAEISEVGQALRTAEENQMPLLSPNNFARAKYKLTEVRELADKQVQSQDLSEALAIAKSSLQKGNEIIAQTNSVTKEIFDARHLALESGAEKMQKDKFDKIDAGIERLGERFESGEFVIAPEEKLELKTRYLALADKCQTITKEQQVTDDKPRTPLPITEAAKFAKKSFTRDEAQVLRTNNVLMIKLNGATFNEGDASFVPEELSTLDKLRDVVGSVSPDHLFIRGHSEDGSPETSVKRASAIAEFLINQQAIDTKKVELIDSALAKSLASGKSLRSGAKDEVNVVIYTSGSEVTGLSR